MTSMPNKWSPLLYNIFKQMLSKTVLNEADISINHDCVMKNLVSKYPNPNDIQYGEKDIPAIILNCKNDEKQISIPFDTNIPSSWNKQLISNLRDILPNTFEISNLDLDCLVDSFKKKFRNPNDFISYVVQAQLNSNNTNVNPPVPKEIATFCSIQAIQKRRNTRHLLFGILLFAIACLIAFYMVKKPVQFKG